MSLIMQNTVRYNKSAVRDKNDAVLSYPISGNILILPEALFLSMHCISGWGLDK